MENSIENEKKSSKTHHFEIYLEYIKKYNVLKMKWTMQRRYPVEIQNIWQEMTKELNDLGGPVRDVTHWKKVFTEWKSHTKRKLRQDRPLNELEGELVHLTGITGTPERKGPQSKKESEKHYKKSMENKENLPIKQIKDEKPESGDGSDSAFVEEHTSFCKAPYKTYLNRSRKEQTKVPNIVSLTAKKSIQVNSKLPSTTNISSESTLDTDTSKKSTSDVSTQVDPNTLDESVAMTGTSGFSSISATIQGLATGTSGLTSLGVAIQSLSNAVNRYCDIVERRIF